MNNVLETIKKYDKDFVKGALWHTHVTRPSRNYIVFADRVDNVKREYGYRDKEYLNGYTVEKMVKVTISEDGFLKSVWYFDTIKLGEQTGYRVRSFKDCLEVQVSKETGNILYMMIMIQAKNMKGASVKVETL